MTPNQAKIVIKNPCFENWDEMKADSGGRFCQSCQKSVIDFTTQSDEEIKAFLEERPGERLCGRFYIQQVKRIRIEIDPNLLVSGIPFWQKFLVVLLICFGPQLLHIDFVFAQTETDSVPVQTTQVDSLVSEPLPQPDSTLEVAIDSLLKLTPPKIEDFGWGSISADPLIIDQYMVMGDFRVPEKPYYPECQIPFPFVKNEPQEVSEKSKTGIAKASENEPVVPKRPRKKPAPAENAIIASADERRRTKRS